MFAKNVQGSARRGMALILVLWLMIVLSAVALEISLLSRLRLQATRHTGDSVRALCLAGAGVERAIADLRAERDDAEVAEERREESHSIYRDVELGSGSYTLLARPPGPMQPEPEFGIADEAARLNLNTTDEQMLSRLPEVDANLAADILLLRQENEKIYDVGDLLLVERVDPLLLYGEDQNQNCLLDPNEDDGEESWPPDNRDGMLQGGLAARLTCFSAVRDVDARGEERVNINQADAQTIASDVPGVSQQQAESIVEHRKKKKFGNIVELLDVELVQRQKKKEEPAQEGRGRPRPGARRGRMGGRPRMVGERDYENGNSGKEDIGNEGTRPGGREGGNAANRQAPRRGPGGVDEPPRTPETGKKTEVTTTGQKAFDQEAFRSMADYVTTSDDEVRNGLINVNTARVEVLACLPGVEESLADEIVLYRRETEFQSIADLLDVPGMTVDKLKQLCGHISVRSDVFRVRSFGVLGEVSETSAPVYCCVSAVIDRTGDRIKVRSWHELR